MNINLEEILQQITELSASYGLKLLAAIVSLWVGWKISSRLMFMTNWCYADDRGEAM